MAKATRLLVLWGLAAGLATAQEALEFEVASVKVVPPRAGSAGFTTMDGDSAMVRYSNITLKVLISIAYRFDSRLVSGGPSWMDTELYDVAANLPPGTSTDRIPAMLQTLLAERFNLVVHRETKEQRVYFLAVGKNGPKLGATADGGGPNQIIPGGITGHSISTGVLAGMLARVTGYEVVDHTGLAGVFDINLTWRRDDREGNGPDLFAAVQEQLGLRLEPGRARVEVLIVERAQRIPTDN